ncbi:MAG TPA: L,D-transpeptidase family protein [Pseudolabrys sp.]
MAAAIALAGCNADGIVPSGRAQAPLSEKTLAEIEAKQMDKDSPILARIFKEEAEMEIWKRNRNGEFALLKTYPICRWSGDLGPKKKEGDRQAPEGFYTITPGQMNPASNYYLAFNTGFPNAYDRAWGYTGSELMVHGDCSSRGCYAMTDEQIQEIYALARESFFGGQNAFQLEAFPFRMTALNMAKHRNNPNFAFWKMLKEGYDNFEATHQEPKVAVCEKRYVFDPADPENSSKPLKFDPKGKCPVYQIDKNIADVVLEKRRAEQFQMAEYIARNVATVPDRQGVDGGMNPVFASKLASHSEYDNNGRIYQIAGNTQAPGALPRTPNPPVAAADMAPSAQPVVMASVPMPTPAPQAKVGEAPPEQPTTITGLLGNMFGGKAEAKPAEPTPAPESDAVALRGSKTDIAAKSKRDSAVRTAAPAPAALPKPREAAPAQDIADNVPDQTPKPRDVASARPKAAENAAAPVKQRSAPQPDSELRTAYSAPPPASSNGLLAGAQPVVPVGSFDSRFNGLR